MSTGRLSVNGAELFYSTRGDGPACLVLSAIGTRPIDLHLQGRLDLDAFVTETIALDKIEKAFERMHGGDVLRSVVVF